MSEKTTDRWITAAFVWVAMMALIMQFLGRQVARLEAEVKILEAQVEMLNK